jgi:hypothetical protein
MWAHDIDEDEYEHLLDARAAAVGHGIPAAAHRER